jgi:hypothetical protein
MNDKIPMGNIRENSFADIWNSAQAGKVRTIVKSCDKQCWMVGNASPVMKKHIFVPIKWILKNKLRVLTNKKPELCFPDIKS